MVSVACGVLRRGRLEGERSLRGPPLELARHEMLDLLTRQLRPHNERGDWLLPSWASFARGFAFLVSQPIILVSTLNSNST